MDGGGAEVAYGWYEAPAVTSCGGSDGGDDHGRVRTISLLCES